MIHAILIQPIDIPNEDNNSPPKALSIINKSVDEKDNVAFISNPSFYFCYDYFVS